MWLCLVHNKNKTLVCLNALLLSCFPRLVLMTSLKRFKLLMYFIPAECKLCFTIYPLLAPLHFSSWSHRQCVRSEAPGKVVLHNVWVLARPHLLDEVSMMCLCAHVCVCELDIGSLFGTLNFLMEMFPTSEDEQMAHLSVRILKHRYTHTHI